MKNNIFISFSVCAMLAACSSVEPINPAAALPEGQCNVRVFQTETQARKGGEIEELCVISGTSAPSFRHTVQIAVEKHKNKACECGGNFAYIQSRNDNPEGAATVTMIAFRYVNKPR